MTIVSILLAAISVTYAPATTNDYCFIKIPATKCESYDSIDLVNSGVTLSGVQNVGTIRRCPVNGQPFEKPYKHEALAWIEEAIKERYAVVNNRTDFPYAENWNAIQGRGTKKNNPLMYGAASKVREPDFSFTNACVVANPSVSGAWSFDVETGQDVRNMIRLHYGGNTNRASITFTRLPEIARGKPVKYNHFSPVVDALKSFGSAAIRDFNILDNVRGTKRASYYLYEGTYITHDYVGDDPNIEVHSYDGIPHETEYIYPLADIEYEGSFAKKRSFYTTFDEGEFSGVSEGASTDYSYKSYDGYFNISNHVIITSVTTNSLYAGGYNRVQSFHMYQTFWFKEYMITVDENGHDVVDSIIYKRVVFPANGTIVFGENCQAAIDHIGINNARGKICIINSFDFKDVQNRVAEAAGSTWMKEYQPDEPRALTADDFDRGWYYEKEVQESSSTRRVKQYVDIGATYVFLDVKFRMK